MTPPRIKLAGLQSNLVPKNSTDTSAYNGLKLFHRRNLRTVLPPPFP